MDIKRVLKKYGFTQKEVAEKLNISKVTLCVCISKKDNINLSTLRKIANVIGCNIQEFFEDETGTPTAVHETGTPTAVCPWCGKPLKVCKGDQSED